MASRPAAPPDSIDAATGLRRGLGLFDSTALVMGSMIGSGIFLVSASMARILGSPGWLLTAWVLTGALTMNAALSFGELGAMMPRAGGYYVFLREAFSPLLGFLSGWSVFLITQTGSNAALVVAFARATGVLLPEIAEDRYLVPPVHLSSHYALSLSTAQLLALGVIALLTWANVRGLELGKTIQNAFTTTNVLALSGMIAICLVAGRNADAIASNFTGIWTPRAPDPVAPGLTAASALGLVVAMGVAQTGSYFSAVGFENLAMAAGEVRKPRWTLPLALALGSGAVIVLYLLANVAYLSTLSFSELRSVPGDQVASAALEKALPGVGAPLMAALIMVSTFGCTNSSILSGARVYYAMARDGLFFEKAARLNRARVPGWSLVAQGIWSAALVLPRTYDPATRTYGNLYGDLLEYVISAMLLFAYALPVAGLFRLRRRRPEADRPYRVPGYPLVPAFYLAGAGAIVIVLLIYRPYTTWPGMLMVLLGVPVYLWRRWRLAGRPGAYLPAREALDSRREPPLPDDPER